MIFGAGFGISPFGDSRALAQGYHEAQGIVLRRKDKGKSQDVLLFLSSLGATWASAPGTGSKNRFGAGTEPTMWGEFRLYQSPKRLYLKGVDVREDFWVLRGSPKPLRMAVKWCGELASRLLPGAESDSLLSLLWGSMKNLASGIDPMLLDLRFAWRWGNLWGLAPPLDACSYCGAKFRSGAGVFFQMTSEGFMCRGCAAKAGSSGTAAIGGHIGADAHDVLVKAATLPKGKFIPWASGISLPAAPLAACAPWLYSFISAK